MATIGSQAVRLVGVFAFVGAGLVLSESVGGGSLIGGAVGWTAVLGGVALAHAALRYDGRSFRDLGLARPHSCLRAASLSVAAAVAIMIAGTWILNAIVPLLDGAPPDSSRFDGLRDNPGVLAVALLGAWIAAAFGEEVLVRGYMMDQLARWCGGTRAAWLGAAALSSVVFGAMHFYQGAAGVAITGIVGFMLAVAYLAVRRNLWVVIGAHGLIDTVSFVTIYLSQSQA